MMIEQTPGPTCPLLPWQLERMLSHHFGRASAVVSCTCRPSAYSSSHALYQLQVEMRDGTALKLIYKSTGTAGLSPSARNVKPEFLCSSRREADVYFQLHKVGCVGPPVLYGVHAEGNGRCGLLLEHVPGVELYQVGELAAWQHVARWLARFHARFASHTTELTRTMPDLVHYDTAYFELWMQRAAAHLVDRLEPQRRQLFRRVQHNYDRTVKLLTDMPSTLIHGEFYASNVLIDAPVAPTRVAPVDWEMAGIGPGLLDLAALVSGKWNSDQMTSLARAYHEELALHDIGCPSWDQFVEQLAACRIQQAVQWLGWSADWRAPAEHSQDWLSIAAELSLF